MPPIVQSVILDVDIEFKKALIENAKIEIQRLDAEIVKLQQDAAKLGTSAPQQFAKLTKEITNLKNEREKLSGALANGNANIDKSVQGFGKLQGAAGLLKGALAGVGVAFGAIQFANFIRNSVNAAAQLEKTAKAFEVFGLSAAKAKKLTEDLDNLAAKVPFEGDQILAVSQNLLKFNVSADELTDVVERLAGIATGAGFSFDALSDAYGRANATGKVFGRDFLQLYKNIPGLVEQISKNTGKTIEQVVKLGKQGKLSFNEFADGIKGATSEQGKYADALLKYQQTFEGTSKQLKEALGDIEEAFGQGLLTDATGGVNSLTSALQRLIPVAEFTGKALGFVVTSVINTLTGKSAFEVQGEIQKRIIDDNKKLRTFLTDQYTQLFGEVKKIGFPVDSEGLTDEEKERLSKLRDQLKKERDQFLTQQRDFNIKLVSEITKSLVETSNKDGIEKEIAKINLALANQIDDLTEQLNKLEAQAFSVNKEVAFETYINFEKLLAQYTEEARIATERILREAQGIAIIVPLEVVPKLLPNTAKKDLSKLVSEINNSIQVPQSTEPSFFQKLFDIPEDKKQEIFDQLNLFQNKATEAAETFIDSQLQRTDFLISESQGRINELLSIQEGGNASQIALEQRRLDRLNEQRRKYLEQQRALDTAQIIANNAITASESIKAIATAFGKSGNPVVGIAASLALVATIASTIVAVNAQLNSIPKFWEGAEEVGKKLKPSFSGRDGHVVRVDGGERVVPTNINKQIPRFVKNADLPGLVTLGLINQQVLNDRNITNEQKETNRLLKQNQKLLKNNTIKLQLIGNENERLRLNRMAR